MGRLWEIPVWRHFDIIIGKELQDIVGTWLVHGWYIVGELEDIADILVENWRRGRSVLPLGGEDMCLGIWWWR